MESLGRSGSLIAAGLAAMVLVSALTESALLWTATLLTAVVAGVVHLWGRYALSRVEYTREFLPARCFVGEEVELRVEVVNRKVLPVTYLAVDDVVPEELGIESRRLSFLRVGKGTLRLLFGLAWYQKVRRRYKVKTSRRGFYSIGPATLTGGDPFGFITASRAPEGVSTLVVYPRVVALERVGIPSRRPFGSLRGGDRIFEDPLRFAGLREYQPGDPMNRIHWPTTAATGRMQVRLLDPSVNPGVTIFLNTWSYEYPWMGTDASAFEAGCVLAASVVSWAAAERVPVGLFANGLVHQWGMNLRLDPAEGAEVLKLALEGLARLQTISHEPLAELIADETPRLSYGTGVVIITRSLPEDLAGAALTVHRSGRPVTLIFTGEEMPAVPQVSGLRTYHVPGEEALHAAVLA